MRLTEEEKYDLEGGKEILPIVLKILDQGITLQEGQLLQADSARIEEVMSAKHRLDGAKKLRSFLRDFVTPKKSK